ncbi:MAG: histidine kinase dimerization/phospho-acceptor domain-containing protein [Vicinamibacterales bacterium]
MVLAIVATIGATGLVLYLQHRSITALRSQTEVILRQVSNNAAAEIAVELRRVMDGPVFDTLTAVNHPELREGRLDLVADHYAKGLVAYPHVDRFFVWNEDTERRSPGEAVFFGRSGQFARDPALGRAIMALARKYRPTQHIYVAAEGLGDEGQYQAFLRLFWTDARRVEYFAVLGFVVDRTALQGRLFDEAGVARLEALLARQEGDVPLQFRVTDETGAVVCDTLSEEAVRSTTPVDMLFYPVNDIRSRLAAGVDPRQWTIEVGAPLLGGTFAGVSGGYGPTLLSVVLMMVALALTLQASRRAADLARMQADFVSHVSHQLKTPLSLLSTAAETLHLDRVRSPEKFASYLETIRTEVSRLSMLVQRVLEFSRLQQRSFEFEAVDLPARPGRRWRPSRAACRTGASASPAAAPAP